MRTYTWARARNCQKESRTKKMCVCTYIRDIFFLVFDDLCPFFWKKGAQFAPPPHKENTHSNSKHPSTQTDYSKHKKEKWAFSVSDERKSRKRSCWRRRDWDDRACLGTRDCSARSVAGTEAGSGKKKRRRRRVGARKMYFKREIRERRYARAYSNLWGSSEVLLLGSRCFERVVAFLKKMRKKGTIWIWIDESARVSISIFLASSRFVRSKMCEYVYIENRQRNEKRESQRKFY